ncbi:MAG TPA: hypothetical protein ENN03_00880 [bacterium]|nr:hypothetical protein [bacterium]
MKQSLQSHFFSLINAWFAFSFLLFTASLLPRWSNVGWQTDVAESLYFLLFLLSFSIFRLDRLNRDIFGLLGLLFLLHSLSIINIYMGESFLFASGSFAVKFFIVKSIILAWIFNCFLIYSAIRLHWIHTSPARLITVAGLFLSLLFFVLFRPLFPISRQLNFMGTDIYVLLFRQVFISYLIAGLFLVFYWIRVLKRDITLGSYMNPLMAVFSLFYLTELADAAAEIFNFRIFGFGLWILITIQILCAGILFKRLFFLGTEYGSFYNSLLRQNSTIKNLPIRRHHAQINTMLLKLLRDSLFGRKTRVLGCFLVLGISMSTFNLPVYAAVNLALFILGTALILWLCHALYRRREQENYLIRPPSNNRPGANHS